MTIDPVTAGRSFRIATACAAGLLVSYGGHAVGASSSFCSTHVADRITTCFLDLRKTPETQYSGVNGGIFVGTSAAVGTPAGGGQQPSLSIQPGGSPQGSGGSQGSSGQTPSAKSNDVGIQSRTGSVRLADVARIQVCYLQDERQRCAAFYEFLLDANPADGSNGVLDEFKISGGPDGADLRFDMDGGAKGDVSVLTSYPDGNGDLRALIPASTFAGLKDDSFVYVYSTYKGAGTQCQDGSGRDSSCPAPAAADAGAADVPLPATALLLGIGLVGMAGIRRRSTPGSGASR